MKTFATLATAGSYSTFSPGQVLVGRTVANAQFLRALARYGAFEELVLFIGETQDAADLEPLAAQIDPAHRGRLKTRHLLELPRALSGNELDVLHHNTPADKLFDLFWLRDRYAGKTIPVTGQIHSLSYPRMVRDWDTARVLTPRACDALFCSTAMGRQVVETAFAALPHRTAPEWELPVVPLGVDLEQVQGGDRRAARQQLSIPENAFVVLSMARFSEYDKMDLFPLLPVFRSLVKGAPDAAAPAYLLLAGARQGTKTPEMLSLWAKVMGVSDRLRLVVDFEDPLKRHLLAASDVFVSPCDNVQETFGQSVVEAMAAGLPVVVSDFDGYKDTVDDEVGVRVTTRRNVDWEELSNLAPLLYERPLHLLLGQSVEVDLPELERALSTLHQHPARARELGEKARARAEGRYAWNKVIPQFEAVWKRLAAKPTPQTGPATHPLRLDFNQSFSHYPTFGPSPSRRVQRTALSRELALPGAGLQYVIYPELKHLFGSVQVMELLEQAEQEVTVEQLCDAAASRRPEQPRWVSALLVGWMLKHGLLG